MTAIGDSKTPVFVGNNGDAKPCTKKLHSVTVQDLGDPDGPLLAYVYIDKVPYPIHDKKTQPVELPVTVQFKDWNGTILSTKTVEKGTEYSSITKPADPSREGYTFTGWGDPTPSTSIQDGKVVADCDVVAQYSIITCEVTFSDWDSRVIEKKTVNWGTNYSSITKPDDPSRTGYTFTGWSEPDPATAVVDDKVIGNCVITARYEIIETQVFATANASRMRWGEAADQKWTNDLGVTWNTSMSSIKGMCITKSSSGRKILTQCGKAANGKVPVFISDDGGKTWSSSSTTIQFQQYCSGGSGNQFILSNVESDYGQDSEHYGIYYSTDGGDTWTKSRSAFGIVDGTAYRSGKFIYGRHYCNVWQVYLSTDGGETWTLVATQDNDHPDTSNVYRFDTVFAAGGYFVLGGAYASRCSVSTDGINWTKLNTTTPAKITAFGYGDSEHVANRFIIGCGPYVMYTDSLMDAWTQSSFVADGNITGVVFDYNSEKFLITTTSSSYTSSDGGISWTKTGSISNTLSIA